MKENNKLLSIKKHDMDIKNLNEVELIKLKVEVENQLKNIYETNIEYKKLSDLNQSDLIYYIEFINGKIIKHEYTDINYCVKENCELIINCYNGLHNFTVSEDEYYNNHCILYIDISIYTTIVCFYTLKPENLKEDLKKEIEKYYNSKIKIIKNEMKDILNCCKHNILDKTFKN